MTEPYSKEELDELQNIHCHDSVRFTIANGQGVTIERFLATIAQRDEFIDKYGKHGHLNDTCHVGKGCDCGLETFLAKIGRNVK